MIALKDLAKTLRLHRVSLYEFCRTHDIPTERRLPAGQSGGQMCKHVTDDVAERLRQHYAARVQSLNG